MLSKGLHGIRDSKNVLKYGKGGGGGGSSFSQAHSSTRIFPEMTFVVRLHKFLCEVYSVQCVVNGLQTMQQEASV